MSNNTILSIIFFITLFSTTAEVYAQQTTLSTGSDIENNSGSVSFSIGQVMYHVQENDTSFLIQGVQQPYDILEIISMEPPNGELEISVYPNPVNERLVIATNIIPENLLAELFDDNGRLVTFQTLTDLENILDTSQLASTIYLLRITLNNELFKTYKIIKHQDK